MTPNFFPKLLSLYLQLSYCHLLLVTNRPFKVGRSKSCSSCRTAILVIDNISLPFVQVKTLSIVPDSYSHPQLPCQKTKEVLRLVYIQNTIISTTTTTSIPSPHTSFTAKIFYFVYQFPLLPSTVHFQHSSWNDLVKTNGFPSSSENHHPVAYMSLPFSAQTTFKHLIAHYSVLIPSALIRLAPSLSLNIPLNLLFPYLKIPFPTCLCVWLTNLL